MTRISVFQCDTEPSLYGYAAERNGQALLRARRDLQWTYLRETEVFPEDGHSAVDVTDMLHNLDRRGYYVPLTSQHSAMRPPGSAKPARRQSSK
jgi:hypothetical protein